MAQSEKRTIKTVAECFDELERQYHNDLFSLKRLKKVCAGLSPEQLAQPAEIHYTLTRHDGWKWLEIRVVTVNNRATKLSLELFQGISKASKLDVLSYRVEDISASPGTWMTDENRQWLREQGWVCIEDGDQKYCSASLVWPELMQTIQFTAVEMVEVLRRQGTGHPTDLELKGNNVWQNQKLELSSLIGEKPVL